MRPRRPESFRWEACNGPPLHYCLPLFLFPRLCYGCKLINTPLISGIDSLATSSYSAIDLPTAAIAQSVQYRLQRKIKREFKLFNASSRCFTLLVEPDVEYPLLAEGHIRPLKVSTAEDNPLEQYSALLDDGQ